MFADVFFFNYSFKSKYVDTYKKINQMEQQQVFGVREWTFFSKFPLGIRNG